MATPLKGARKSYGTVTFFTVGIFVGNIAPGGK
jgi:hypothetical protein